MPLSSSCQPTIVSVVMVTHNNAHHVSAALRSALDDPFADQIVVVDNASSDRTLSLLLEVSRDTDRVTVVRSTENVGFAKATNIAVTASTGDYLLLLNPDTQFQSGCLASMLSRFADPAVGIVGPALIRPNGSIDPACARFAPTRVHGLLHLLPIVRRWARYHDRSPKDTVQAVSGACLLIRRELWDRVGGLDEDYWMYGEDLDLCLRVRQFGYRVAFEKKARVLHIKGGSNSHRHPAFKTTVHFYRALGLYYVKNLSPRPNGFRRHLVPALAASLGVVCGSINGISNWVESRSSSRVRRR